MTMTMALNFSLKANLILKCYLNPKWFTSRLMEYAHPLCKNRLFPFLQLPHSMFTLIDNTLIGMSPFLRDALKSWLWYQYYPPDEREGILHQVIWFNANILIQGKPFFWKIMFEKKILFLKDIVCDDGNIMTYC